MIVDDELNRLLVNPLIPGVRLHIVLGETSLVCSLFLFIYQTSNATVCPLESRQEPCHGFSLIISAHMDACLILISIFHLSYR